MKSPIQTCEQIEKDALQRRLAGHPFLGGMSPHHIELLLPCASAVQFKPGDIIFRTGETANGFYLIESGKVVLEGSVFDHAPIATDIVSGGEPLGWSWLFPPFRWHFDARATEPTTAIFFNTTKLREHYGEDLTLANELFRRCSEVMVHRLQDTRRKLIAALHQSQLDRAQLALEDHDRVQQLPDAGRIGQPQRR